MLNYEEKKAIIEDILDSLGDDELVAVHNEYCDARNDSDNRIYSMDEFNEIMEGYTPLDIAQRIQYGDFNSVHDYFWFDGYANLDTGDGIVKHNIFIGEIAEYILDNEDFLGCDKIEDQFDEWASEDEDETEEVDE